MTWRKCCIMEERMRFVIRALEGDSVSSLCREFGISRKTGYKFLKRYQDFGIEALRDESRKPLRNANKLSVSIEEVILSLKEEKPDWGARKLRERLIRKYPDIQPPAKSTVHAVLARNGKVKQRGRPRYHASGTLLKQPVNPNDIWATDFKGQFRLGNGRYCYPLTVSDLASRYILACESLESVQENPTFPIFEEVFQKHGLPFAIRTDNGVPFASPGGLFGLSKLSVWWLTLGIRLERIAPGNPQQNGCHERMHRTLKAATTKPAATNTLQQQEKFDSFIEEFNNERPHEALNMKYPAECYSPSTRLYKEPTSYAYPFHDFSVKVHSCGSILLCGKRIYVSCALSGQTLGVSELEDEVWKLSFLEHDLGFCDLDSKKFEPGSDPFAILV